MSMYMLSIVIVLVGPASHSLSDGALLWFYYSRFLFVVSFISPAAGVISHTPYGRME